MNSGSMTTEIPEIEVKCLKMQRQVLRDKSVTLKYVGHENAGYIKFSVFA